MHERFLGKGAYSIPEISIKDPNDRFIYFRFTHQGKDYNRKYREGINRIRIRHSEWQISLSKLEQVTNTAPRESFQSLSFLLHSRGPVIITI